jgi:hypothetical protein
LATPTMGSAPYQRGWFGKRPREPLGLACSCPPCRLRPGSAPGVCLRGPPYPKHGTRGISPGGCSTILAIARFPRRGSRHPAASASRAAGSGVNLGVVASNAGAAQAIPPCRAILPIPIPSASTPCVYGCMPPGAFAMACGTCRAGTSQRFVHLIDGIIRKAGRPLEIRTGDLRLERASRMRRRKMKEVEERTSELGRWVNVRRSRTNGNKGQRHVFGRECVLNVSCPAG